MPSKAIISALREAYTLAALAYWKNNTHCGSDIEAAGRCMNCQHWHACVLSAAYHKSIAEVLKEGEE